MNLDITFLFNLILGALSFLGGWLFTRVFSLFDKQENLMKEINDKTFSDFIFNKKIKGLITKFGGVNSHMAIRCAELSLPAAIGVGEIIYKTIQKKKYITLDCGSQKIS